MRNLLLRVPQLIVYNLAWSVVNFRAICSELPLQAFDTA